MKRTAKAALWLVAGHVAVLAACGVGALTQSDQVSGAQCEGIGWGCTMSPRDGSLFVLVLIVLPAALISLLVCLVTIGVVAAIRDRRRKRSV